MVNIHGQTPGDGYRKSGKVEIAVVELLARTQMMKGRAKRANITFLPVFFFTMLRDVCALKYKYVWVQSIVLPFLVHTNFSRLKEREEKWNEENRSSLAFVPSRKRLFGSSARCQLVPTLFLFGSTRIILFSCVCQRWSYSTGCVDRLVYCMSFKDSFIMVIFNRISCFTC